MKLREALAKTLPCPAVLPVGVLLRSLLQSSPRKLAWATGAGYTAPVPATPMAAALPATHFAEHSVVSAAVFDG